MRFESDTTNFVALLAVSGLVVCATSFALSLLPNDYDHAPAGIVETVIPSGRGDTIVTTQSRRYLVEGTWAGLPGIAVETRTPEQHGQGIPLVNVLVRKALPELCVEGGDNCAAILN